MIGHHDSGTAERTDRARYLFTTWHAHGGLAPLLALARDLLRRGHDVRVLGDPASASDVAGAGLEFETWQAAPAPRTTDPEDVRFRDWEVEGPRAFELLVEKLAYGPARLHAQDVLESYARAPFDVLVAEQFLPGALVAAEHLGCRRVMVIPNIDMRPVPGRPPAGPGFAPKPGILGRLRDTVVGFMGNRIFESGLAPLNAARSELGLQPLDSVHDLGRRADLVMVLSAPSFDWATSPDENVLYVGPVLDDPVWDGDHEIDAVVPEGDEPLVLVSLGTSMQDQRQLYQRIIEALGGLDVRGVVTLGGVFDPECFSAPANVRVVRTAPHRPILDEASAAVLHCGHGSVMRALVADVPIVAVPLGRDQNENAVRVTERNAGVRVAPEVSTQQLRRAIRTVVSEPGYAQAARRLGATIREETRPGVAIAELERLVPRKPEISEVQTRSATGSLA